MLRLLSGNFHRLVYIGALSLSVAVLVCLSVVFAACTSPSSSSQLYFMKVNFSEFPRIGSIHLPRSMDLSGVASSVTNGATSVASDATESLAGAAAKASSAADAAANEANDALMSLQKTLKSELPAFYTVGLWSYCKGNNTHATFCSRPSTSFTFNISGILNSISTEMSELVPEIDEGVLNGYHEVSNAVTWLYIFGFVCATITTLLATRKIFFNGGSKLLIIFGMLSFVFITAGTIAVTVIYGTITAGIKTILGSFGASASLGSQTLASSWLAVAFSVAVLTVWLVEFCCCAVSPL